jgi:hypothetical protein
MTDHSNSDVGRAAIEAYLDSVDEALIAAHAPRSDRMQVLQDLESQIADMLSQQPQPLTEDAVVAVIKTLEPPSHFAATYGNGKQPTAPATEFHWRLPKYRWPLVSAISAAVLPVGCLLLWFAIGTRAYDAAGFIVLLLFVSCVFTPFALWRARKQLRAEAENPRDRDLMLKSTIVYAAVAPALVVALAAAATEGVALILLGVVAFVYIQYLVIRRVCRYMMDGVPQSAPAPSTPTSNGNGISTALTPAGP